jgi:hypothetical protein
MHSSLMDDGQVERCLDADPPAKPGETCARLRRRSTLSRHCLCASGEAASPGGLRSNSLAATSGPFGAGCDWTTEACSAARCGAARAAALVGGRREACGVDDATSSPKRSLDLSIHFKSTGRKMTRY